VDVVVVGAEWCGNCPAVKDNLKHICQENNISLKVLDFDNDFEEVKKLGVRSLPTVLFNGKILTGSKTKTELEKFLEV